MSVVRRESRRRWSLVAAIAVVLVAAPLAVAALPVRVEHDGAWRIALFHNTPAQYHGRPDLADEHTAEMRDAMRAAAQQASPGG